MLMLFLSATLFGVREGSLACLFSTEWN